MQVMLRTIGVFLLALFLAACSAREQPKRYPMQGEIKALDANAKTATIAAGQIGDWMGPMTMEYAVKPDAEFLKLHAGDHIEATVVVNDLAYYVTDVKVVPKN
jgi:Cu/Ag efflux protein CusF